MRLGRILLLASLAQLLGLTALAAALAEHPAFTKDSGSEEGAPAWRAAFAAPVANAAAHSRSQVRTPALAVLALSALAATPLRRAVWMVTPAVGTAAAPRPRRYALLRC
jgi:hypothetical protein